VSALRILAAAFNAVEPGAAVRANIPTSSAQKIFAFGLGKAACAMTGALADKVELIDTLIITKHASPLDFEPVSVILGDHPIPGESSLRAGQATIEFVSQLTADDLLICLISGGGSALMTAPLIPLEDLKALTSALLKCGARIDEINTLRRHLDRLKGGGLASLANGAQIVSLILSDVVGDSLETIASGPTAPDPTTKADALAIIEKYGLANRISTSIVSAFRETSKSVDPVFARVENKLIASNVIALQAAKLQAENEGFQTKIVSSELQGEAREIGRQMAQLLKDSLAVIPRPFCLLSGGETTVTISGDGKGGRNQELALGAVSELSGLQGVMLISIATDGEDGPTDAAGAVVTGETAHRGEMLKIDASSFLSRNDAFTYFAKLGDLIQTGPSGTNVNDLVLAFAF
jgi:hydroxypyruvate reductase